MVMDPHDIALIAAGALGAGVAVIHGVLTERLMVKPFEALAGPHVSAPISKLVPLLLQFSTFNWFIGGLALVFSVYALGAEARLVTGALVGSSYLFGTLGNFWATRGRHPGWALYAVALGLIVFGLMKPGGGLVSSAVTVAADDRQDFAGDVARALR
jgi:hypothetical protein